MEFSAWWNIFHTVRYNTRIPFGGWFPVDGKLFPFGGILYVDRYGLPEICG